MKKQQKIKKKNLTINFSHYKQTKKKYRSKIAQFEFTHTHTHHTHVRHLSFVVNVFRQSHIYIDEGFLSLSFTIRCK